MDFILADCIRMQRLETYMQAFIQLRMTPAQVNNIEEAQLPQHLYLHKYTAKQ